MSESTAEQPAAETTLHDDLEATFAELQPEEPEPTGEAAEEASETPAEESQESEETASEESEEHSEEQSEESTEEQKLEPPEHWRAEHKETFEKLDKDAQEFLLERHKEMEGDYTRKSQELADIRKQAEAFQPVQEIFQHFPNLQPVPTIKQWANIAYNLEQNPQQTLQKLAQQHNVDLGQQQEEQGFVDPQVQSLQQQLQTMQQTMVQQEQQQKEQQQNAVLDQIKEFSEAKTEAGETAHPYFDELYPDMVRLAHAERVAGREPSLEKLYEDAKWVNPEVRSKIESAQRKAAEKKAEAEARAKAEKAKRAAKTATRGTGAESPSDDLGLREMLESQMT